MNLTSMKKADLIALIERERATHIRHYAEKSEWCRKEVETLQERLAGVDTDGYEKLEAQVDSLRSELENARAYLERNNAPLDLLAFDPARTAYELALNSIDDALRVESVTYSGEPVT